jgi:leucine dehydrogenase
VSAAAIYTTDADIFAPCALGAVVNDDTIDGFKFDIVAGAANNQLARADHGEALEKKNILYAPDYVINAGGLINVYGELEDWSPERSKRKAGDIYNTLLRIFDRAKADKVPTNVAADRVAEARIMESRQLQRSYL